MFDLKVCRICLAKGVKMHPMHKYNLDRSFEVVTGLQIQKDDGMPKYLCFECATLVHKYQNFRRKCRRADSILLSILEENDEITPEEIDKVDRKETNIISPLTFWNTELDCFFSYIYEQENALESKEDLYKIDFKLDLEPLDNIDEPFDEPSAMDSFLLDSLLETPTVPKEPEINLNADMKNAVNLEEIIAEQTCDAQKIFAHNVQENLEQSFGEDEHPVKEKRKAMKRKISNKMSKRNANISKTMLYADEYYEQFATVTVMSIDEQIQEIEKRKETSRYKSYRYKCDVCYDSYKEKRRYKQHMRRHDPASGHLECVVCRSRFKFNCSLKRHMESFHTKRYACKTCPYVTVNPTEARRHNDFHQGNTFYCRKCNSSFQSYVTFLTHKRDLHPNVCVCVACGRSFHNEIALHMHRKVVHKTWDGKLPADASGPECAECRIKFWTEDAYQKHFQTAAKHLQRECDNCGGECVCNERPIHNRKDYGDHMRSSHNRSRSPMRTVCEICGREFHSKVHFINHQRVHAGEKLFKCNECDKSFYVKDRLVYHMTSHTGERPHTCDVCGKGFKARAHLLKHNLMHNGVYKYPCQYCGKMFRLPRETKYHVDHVHFKKPYPKRSRPRDRAKRATVNSQYAG